MIRHEGRSNNHRTIGPDQFGFVCEASSTENDRPSVPYLQTKAQFPKVCVKCNAKWFSFFNDEDKNDDVCNVCTASEIREMEACQFNHVISSLGDNHITPKETASMEDRTDAPYVNKKPTTCVKCTANLVFYSNDEDNVDICNKCLISEIRELGTRCADVSLTREIRELEARHFNTPVSSLGYNRIKPEEASEQKLKKRKTCEVCKANAMIDWEVFNSGQVITQPNNNEHTCLLKHRYMSVKYSPQRKPYSDLEEDETTNTNHVEFPINIADYNAQLEKQKVPPLIDDTVRLRLKLATFEHAITSIFPPPQGMEFESMKMKPTNSLPQRRKNPPYYHRISESLSQESESCITVEEMD